MRVNGTWAGEPEVIASSKKYGVNMKIVTSAKQSTMLGQYVTEYKQDGATETLYFGHIHESHYISLGMYINKYDLIKA